jgi:hypothetical protein
MLLSRHELHPQQEEKMTKKSYDSNEMLNLLMSGATEIEVLRRRLEIAEAKISVMDLFACTLMTRPYQQSQGMAEDIAWKMRNAAASLSEKTT